MQAQAAAPPGVRSRIGRSAWRQKPGRSKRKLLVASNPRAGAHGGESQAWGAGGGTDRAPEVRLQAADVTARPAGALAHSQTAGPFCRPLSPEEGTCPSRLPHPPNAVPFHTRPVTSWKGRVAISLPDAATPITTDSPQPRCAHSSAARMTCGTGRQAGRQAVRPRPNRVGGWAGRGAPDWRSRTSRHQLAWHPVGGRCEQSESLPTAGS